MVGGFCVERSHAARRHAQRCGAPKAPLKGELAARNALSEGFCGRASGAWSNNALPTSLLLRKTSQSASLTAPLSGEPLAFAALRVTTSSVALVDAVGRRPRWSCVTAAVRKRKRSGKRFAHRQTGYGCSHKSAWHSVQCAAAVPTPYQGWVLRAGPPALSGVFLPLFFLRRRRKNGAPGGRKQVCLEEIRIRKPPTTPASKLALCVVSASAAASGQLTRPDNGCSHKSAWHPVQCAAVVPMRYAGVGS